MSIEGRIEKNKRFLRNIYSGGAFERHALVVGSVSGETPNFGGFGGLGDYTLSARPVSDWVPWARDVYQRRVEFLGKVEHDGVPLVPMVTGTHIYAAAFGCGVEEVKDSNPMARYLVHNAEEADKLQIPDLWSSPTLVRPFELARAVLDELGPETPISVPDMQSGFDIACQIWEKADLFCAMMDEAGAASVKRLTAKCSTLLTSVIKAWRQEFPSSSPNHCPGDWCPPELGPWVSNDECGSLNTAMFEEFCLPELIEMSRDFNGIGMHCCADAEHQFESFKRIPKFYAFNRVQARRGYGPTVEMIGGSTCPVLALAGVPEDEMVRLLRAAPAKVRYIFTLAGGTVDEVQRQIERMRANTP